MMFRARVHFSKVLLPLVALLGLFGSAVAGRTVPAAAAGNPIVTENQLPGSNAWATGSLVATDTAQQIKGYASTTSVMQGGSLTLYVTVNPVQTYSIDVYRIGWYGGAGGRLRLHAGPLAGIQQPACPPDPTTGLIACNWTPSYTMAIPSDWTSGVYLALLTNAQGYQNYAQFVVRDGRPAAFLYQQSVSTYQAYNDYPNDNATGKSLYGYNSYGANTVGGGPAAVKVSFDRPYADDGSGQFFNWEINLIRWLERSGYDVTYSTNLDTHANGAELLNHRGFLSTGHDEYWSMEMYNAAQAARDAGVNLAFFGSDSIFWQVRFESSAAGVANRVMVGYKSASVDPVQGPTTTVEWRNAPVNRPEQTIKGGMYTSSTNWGILVGYVVTNSNSWVYANTGFKDGDTVPGIVGYEMDRYMSDVPGPPTTNLTLLSHSPYTNNNGAADYSNSSIYQVASGAWVFSTGTMSWSWALDNWGNGNGVVDQRIQQTTANVLNAFLTSAPLPIHDLKVVVPATATAGQAFAVSVTAEDANGSPVTWYTGTVHFAGSDTSSGVILPADSTLTNGQGTFSATMIKAGPQTLTVSDAANALSTTVNLVVIPQAANRLALATAATPTAGTGFSFTATALDPYGNIDTNYAGTVHFSTGDTSPGVSLPPNSTLTNGQRTFSATLIKAGSTAITGTDTANSSVSGSLTVRVAPAAASVATVSAPSSARANQPFAMTVTLRDRFGNLATTYTGTLHFTSSDLVAQMTNQLPADYTYTAADGGSHSFASSLVTPGTQTITATDTTRPTLTGTSGSITVSLL